MLEQCLPVDTVGSFYAGIRKLRRITNGPVEVQHAIDVDHVVEWVAIRGRVGSDAFEPRWLAHRCVQLIRARIRRTAHTDIAIRPALRGNPLDHVVAVVARIHEHFELTSGITLSTRIDEHHCIAVIGPVLGLASKVEGLRAAPVRRDLENDGVASGTREVYVSGERDPVAHGNRHAVSKAGFERFLATGRNNQREGDRDCHRRRLTELHA